MARPQLGAPDIGAYEYVDDCSGDWSAVGTASALNYAIDCFNQEVSGTRTITLTDSFTLTEQATTISNGQALLEIAGNGYTINGNGNYRGDYINSNGLPSHF